jgi:hypothetical protein
MNAKHTIRIAKQLPGYHKKAFQKLLSKFDGLNKLDYHVKQHHKLNRIHSIEGLIVLIAHLQVKGIISLKDNVEDSDFEYFI